MNNIIAYHHIGLMRALGLSPETEFPEVKPALMSDIAPVPVWLVTPGWRMARLSDLAQAAGVAASPDIQSVTALLYILRISWASPVDEFGYVIGKAGTAAVAVWQILARPYLTPTGEYLVLWRTGR